jgi:thiosulfate/3-mercaptopyruvate sulfurtransferase
MKRILVLFIVLAAVPRLGAAEKGYARPQLLIEPAELAKPDVARSVVILDARSRKKYDAGHIPGARWVSFEEWTKAFQDGKDAEAWSKRLAALGITLDAKVVIYDEAANKDASRIWWVLRYWGVKDARVVNGGWRGWEAGKYPVDDKVPAPAANDLTLKPQGERLATKAFLLQSLKGDKLQIVDTRSADEFCGKLELAKRGGAIPGARLLDWSTLVDAKTHRFKDADELRKLFREAGIALDRPTVTYCQSGGRASVMQFAMELMGADAVRNYYGSWAEWGNAEDTPVEAGKLKKPE